MAEGWNISGGSDACYCRLAMEDYIACSDSIRGLFSEITLAHMMTGSVPGIPIDAPTAIGMVINRHHYSFRDSFCLQHHLTSIHTHHGRRTEKGTSPLMGLRITQLIRSSGRRSIVELGWRTALYASNPPPPQPELEHMLMENCSWQGRRYQGGESRSHLEEGQCHLEERHGGGSGGSHRAVRGEFGMPYDERENAAHGVVPQNNVVKRAHELNEVES